MICPHRSGAAELRRRHPSIDVDANVLYVDNGRVLTSAGAAAGFDLCIHMVRRDLGADVAASVARLAVMPLERAGGQAQFIEHAPPSEAPGAMTPLLTWMEQNLSRELPLPVIARRAAMSTRTLSRRFREQVGATPAAWLAHARVRRAQRLLETTDLAVEQVAAEVRLRVRCSDARALRNRGRHEPTVVPAGVFGAASRRESRSIGRERLDFAVSQSPDIANRGPAKDRPALGAFPSGARCVFYQETPEVIKSVPWVGSVRGLPP